MAIKRIKSEYMKKFKDPKWDSYAKCYEDLLKYRLSRRLLEQSHNPWFWDDLGSDTESSGKSSPVSRNKVEPLNEETPAAAPRGKATEETAELNQAVHERETAQSPTSPVIEQVVGDVEPKEKEEERSRQTSPVVSAVQQETETPALHKTKNKSWHPHKPARLKSKPQITKDTDRESRHPFAMYGSGERQAEVASKRTHNVGPAASTTAIHQSALRAKTRREVEKKMKKVDKQRAKSADLEKMNKSKIIPDFNPWMTEYMRCFSARSR